MGISDWISDVCSSDLALPIPMPAQRAAPAPTMASPAPRGAMEQPGGIGVASSRYVLGPDDVIEVSALGRPEMTHQTRIKPDGTIVLPLAGTVKASHHTLLTLADEIGKKMEEGGFLRNPLINVDIGRASCRKRVFQYV